MSEHPDYSNLRALGDQYFDGSSEPGRYTAYTITHDLNQVRVCVCVCVSVGGVGTLVQWYSQVGTRRRLIT
jgi:hypothetical protein